MSQIEAIAAIKRYLVHRAINGNRNDFKWVLRLFQKYPELVSA